jgi:hypothetical protein
MLPAAKCRHLAVVDERTCWQSVSIAADPGQLSQQGADLKKRETMMVGRVKETTGRIGELESALQTLQLEHERLEFSLRAKTSAIQ